ncbi:hypothetical protein COAQ111491_07055 [Comamonas aquatilis]
MYWTWWSARPLKSATEDLPAATSRSRGFWCPECKASHSAGFFASARQCFTQLSHVAVCKKYRTQINHFPFNNNYLAHFQDRHMTEGGSARLYPFAVGAPVDKPWDKPIQAAPALDSQALIKKQAAQQAPRPCQPHGRHVSRAGPRTPPIYCRHKKTGTYHSTGGRKGDSDLNPRCLAKHPHQQTLWPPNSAPAFSKGESALPQTWRSGDRNRTGRRHRTRRPVPCRWSNQ